MTDPNQSESSLTSSKENAPAQAIEATVFRRLIAHLQARTEVQNIDLMLLADFCRNCLSEWYREAAEEHELPMTEEAAKRRVYGMEYADWKAMHQHPVPAEKLAAFEAKQSKRGKQEPR